MARQELFEILLDRIEARLLQDEPINAYIAVQIAAEFNHQSVVDRLLKRASRFGMNVATHRALQLAAKNGNDAMCRSLVDEGALDDFDPSDPHKDIIEEILVTAIAAGNVTLIKKTIASFCLSLTRRPGTHPPRGSKVWTLHPHLRGSGSNLTDPNPDPD
jgi:hypothetical protein